MPGTRMKRVRHRHTGWFAQFFAAAVLVVAGVAAAGMMIVVATASRSAGPAMQPVQGWEAALDLSRSTAPTGAPVRIVEFSDFQCPYCARAQADLQALHARYPESITVTYRHFPLKRIHPFAMASALAAECAREQGRFQAFHDVLFSAQARIGTAVWGSLAAEAGVPDRAAFDQCLRSQRYRRRIDQDLRLGQRLGIVGTPSFIVEGQLVGGRVNSLAVDSIIQARLAAYRGAGATDPRPRPAQPPRQALSVPDVARLP